jgi:hypothetical protein
MEIRMNVLTVTGRIVGDPIHRSAPDGEWCEFRLAVDAMPWLEFVVRATSSTATSGGTLTTGCRVTVVATLRHDGWVVRDGTRAECWSVNASAVNVLDDDHRDKCSRPLR